MLHNKTPFNVKDVVTRRVDKITILCGALHAFDVNAPLSGIFIDIELKCIVEFSRMYR